MPSICVSKRLPVKNECASSLGTWPWPLAALARARASGRRIGASRRNLLAGVRGQFILRRVDQKLHRHGANVFLIILSFLAIPLASGKAEEPTVTQAELLQCTQGLFDALPPGDVTPYKKYYADDCLYHDEKGRTFDKAGLLGDISPMPKGYSGVIKLMHPKSLVTHDCAILSYDIDESETIFGQELHARYHQTDTWLSRSGTWQIAATEVMRYYEDPAEGKADPARFAAYIGTYELSKESDRRTVISVEDGHLMMERAKGTKTPLFPEATDLFFRKGVEGRILFRLGADGTANAFLDRRNNEDVLWKKIP